MPLWHTRRSPWYPSTLLGENEKQKRWWKTIAVAAAMAMVLLPRSSLPLAPRSTVIGPLLASPAPNSRSSGCSGSLLVSSAFFGPLACPTSCRIAHRELSRTTSSTTTTTTSLRRLLATSPRNNNLQCLHHHHHHPRRRQFMISAPLLFIIAEVRQVSR